jgi:putative ABC transport system permease protein
VSGILAANLLRRPARTLLTALGTALGVATIVALLAVTDGLRSTAGQLAHLGRADLGLFQLDAADPTTSVLPVSLVPRVEATPGVARAMAVQLLPEAVPGDPAAMVFGADPRGFLGRRLVLTAGRQAVRDGETTLGDRLAGRLGLGVGDTLAVRGRRLRIVGVHHAGVAFEDEGAIVTLALAQRLAGRPGEATTIIVQADPAKPAADLAGALGRRFAGVVALADPGEAVRAGVNGRLVSQAATVIVVLALLIGGIAVMNTMLLATVERRGEFAVMSAVGWSGPQVAGVVLAEGAATGLLGALLGLALGIAAAGPLIGALGAGDWVDPRITAWGLGRGLLVGGALGVVGGLYPAWRVTRQRTAAVLASR